MKEFTCVHKPSGDAAEDVTHQFLIHDDYQLREWKEHLITLPNYITSGEVSIHVNELVSHNKMRIQIASPNKSEKSSSSMLLSGAKPLSLTISPRNGSFFYLSVLATEHFSQWLKEGDCQNWRGICMVPTVAKIVAKIIQERMVNSSKTWSTESRLVPLCILLHWSYQHAADHSRTV